MPLQHSGVALRKESVDRNICTNVELHGWPPVALRKESVDRNSPKAENKGNRKRSLSARRAWIEIAILWKTCEVPTSRSPQGERG